ncbi:MAG: hypothetical protein H6577_11735 [Lewinellaceae bacterium]|nr:hypothetical protein [Saprospiraceae bacterium]MCB9338788.1 hypothetical protein [Lewinellaceae bacterium]
MKYLLEHVIGYYPFGKTLREYVFNRERFQTTYHERDEETGLDYRGARFYDGEVGRFLSTDPKALDFAAWGTYVYTLDNPLRLVDPDGRAPQDIIYSTTRNNDGSITLNVTVRAKLINLSHSQIGVGLEHSIESKAKNAFSGSFSYRNNINVNVNFSLDLTLINNVSEIGENDHVIAITDDIPFQENSHPAGISKLEENIALVEGSLSNTEKATVAAHELGHNLGLQDDYLNTGNVMADVKHSGSNPKTSKTDRMYIFAALANDGNSKQKRIRNMKNESGNSRNDLSDFIKETNTKTKQ